MAYAFRVYLRAELPVRGRRLLAAARGSALVLILALLFDPPIPQPGAPGSTSGARWVLLDASRSMSAAGGRPWREAVRVADSMAAQGWRVVPFGGAREGLRPDTVPPAPTGPRTRLAPSLERAAESGVARVTVLSDMRFEDRGEVEATLATLAATPLRVTFRDVGGDVVNAGIASFRVPAVGRKGDTATAELELFARSGGADSLALEILEEGRPVLTRTVPAPAPGRVERTTVRLPPAREVGWVRYQAAVRIPGDAFPSDDNAVAYASVGAPPGGLVVVSLHPDWESRALLSVLEETTGLKAAGYLRVGADRFTPMGRAVRRGVPVDSAAVRRAAGAADVLVVQGLERATDAWGRSLPERAARVLLWPLDASAANALGVHAGPVRDGEWYASGNVPSSPLAADLSGAELRDLPPLTAVLPVSDAPAGSVPLRVQRQGSGPLRPALLLHREGGRREAVVLASGFWRWAARDGDGRDVYRRLWSGVAGWLLTRDARGASGEARPDRRVYGPGQDVRWRIPGGRADSARLSVVAAGDTVLDTVLAAETAGTAGTAGTAVSVGALPPGSYAYHVRGPGHAVAQGRFDVEERSLEMLPARAVPAASDSGRPNGVGASGPVGGTRPLRTSPWPYLLILGLLCAEWVGRRRAGLR